MVQEKMNDHTSKVTSLKNKFANICKNDGNESTIDILEKMRIIHGRAIYDDAINKHQITMKNIDEITNEDYINLSVNASYLYLIHNHIRNCEKMEFLRKKGKKIPEQLTSESDGQISSLISKDKQLNAITNQEYNVASRGSSNTKISPIITRESNDTDLLSIRNMETENDFDNESFNSPRINTNDLFESENNNMMGGTDDVINNFNEQNLTDFVNNLTSSEAARLESEYDKSSVNTFESSKTNSNNTGHQTKSVNNPTLVNFWADWCGYSKKFAPKWEEFKKNVDSKFHNLQVADLNVKKDKKLIDLGKSVGAEGYPTLVFFYNGKIYKKTAGNLTADDVEKFVNEIINK
jgi:thiol-disulfide isomerase/thioredoxin